MRRDEAKQDVLGFLVEGAAAEDCTDWVKRHCAICRGVLDELGKKLAAMRSQTDVGGELGPDADARFAEVLELLERYRKHAEV